MKKPWALKTETSKGHNEFKFSVSRRLNFHFSKIENDKCVTTVIKGNKLSVRLSLHTDFYSPYPSVQWLTRFMKNNKIKSWHVSDRVRYMDVRVWTGTSCTENPGLNIIRIRAQEKLIKVLNYKTLIMQTYIILNSVKCLSVLYNISF